MLSHDAVFSFFIFVHLVIHGYCYSYQIIRGHVVCTGCDNPTCFPNRSEYTNSDPINRRRVQRSIDTSRPGRFYGTPHCKTISPDANSFTSDLVHWFDNVNCTMRTITCRCVKWFNAMTQGGMCFPSNFDTSGRRRQRQRRGSNVRSQAGRPAGSSGPRGPNRSAPARSNAGTNNANQRAVQAAYKKKQKGTSPKSFVKRPTTDVRKVTNKNRRPPAKKYLNSPYNRKNHRIKSSWNRRAKDAESETLSNYILQFHVCTLTETDHKDNYFEWRDMCYRFSSCSYPQAQLPEPYKSYWFLFQSDVLLRGEQRIYPGRFGTSREYRAAETQAKTYREFCEDISKQYRPNDAPFYTFERFDTMDMLGDRNDQPLDATIICTGCDSQVCNGDDLACTHFAQSPDRVAPRYVQQGTIMKCYMRIVRCRCKRPSMTTGRCLDPNPNKPVNPAAQPGKRRQKQKQQQKQQRRHRRSASILDTFLTNFGRAVSQDAEYIDQTVCVGHENDSNPTNWVKDCNNVNCEYFQPQLKSMGDRQYLLFYRGGTIWPGFITADDGYGYRKIEQLVMTRDDFCANVGTPGYYHFDSVLRLNEKTTQNVRRRGARA